MVWALLPLKDFVNAKQRLSGVLAAHERRHLFHTMVEDVLDILANHPMIDNTVIVSDDPSAELLADRYQLSCWAESSLALAPDVKGLTAVVDAAAAKLAEQGVDSMLVVHGDLPLLDAADIQRLLEVHQEQVLPGITIAPDAVKDGSNCVVATPPNAIQFQYGKGSFEKHMAAAAEEKVSAAMVALPSAAMDIDNPSDLQGLLTIEQVGIAKHTLTYLQESGLKERLNTMLDNQFAPLGDEVDALLEKSLAGELLTNTQALILAEDRFSSQQYTEKLMLAASQLRDQGFRNVVTYSRKVFIPLTHLCRDVCHYCTFAQTPKKIPAPYMSVDEVLASVRAGVAQGCKEALFTLGEKPELRYSAARNALADMGFETTLEYVAHVAKRVFEETGILPHINAGCMTADEIELLRPVSASMGIMLESASSRLCEKGMPHYGSPDKDPAVRLETIELAGQASVPFTSGILIGIGETRAERIESLLALRASHLKHGHLQEIIVQNFRAKEQTKMAQAPEPDLNELLWTIAATRIIFGDGISIQAPPNLSPGVLPKIVNSGINDWGGVSPITPDFVNPEAPWPHVEKLAKETAVAGKYLHERLTIYPNFALDGKKWLHEDLQTPVLRMIDAEGFPRVDEWAPGESVDPPASIMQQLKAQSLSHISVDIQQIVAKARAGSALTEANLVRLFQARGDDFSYVCQQADQFRQQLNGDTVSYVVNRNINYTNICYFKCQFCAFSKGKLSENLRGRPYDLGHEEITRRCNEAWQRGATEVCMQGGIHPEYTGDTYLEILKTVKAATPDMHIHAFSPLEVWQGAATLGISLHAFLKQLKEAGLNTLPGTAAEVLDDEVRADLCPDKINTEQWLEVMETAHGLGFKTTATIMYGHIEKHQHWARHLLRVSQLQQKTGGFTEFVPLPFVHMEAPLYLKGKARTGPTFREALLMHAVARLALSPHIPNIQTSWVKMGEQGIVACLEAGANDLGGTLMNETITRAAGSEHGQECSPETMEALIGLAGREAKRRSTVYGEVSTERIETALRAEPLVDVVNTPVKKYDRKSSGKVQLIANA
ncbi:5-amino-6-(D-ribitylamino)uracil--L-tyrosine 4-hydroxyphenyl transferase CofH [Oceanicoccus sagamiensis]|uniref:3-phospho-D-glycerate guanylyltransferase n=1 Tax=Oceanicoccus sagamiensis TaxID=716816 RepID=A0A1X9NDX3_9GAMM|nr:5-amino-6-(D-ribitylamino)uracil--L-tyrosine 4-hydroxyphenyl transferase CofH [Oceanicoccus sagamiensis]ARN75341.1 2-phospho-L-lactate guanylyltransferase [Oceanicoccus sagamiensis]